MSEITENLIRRETQGVEWWDSGQHSTVDSGSLRGFSTNATLIGTLADEHRRERCGLAFAINFDTRKERCKFYLHVRIKAKETVGKEEVSWPYVVVYVTDTERDTEDEVICEHFSNTYDYDNLSKLSVADWYTVWLKKALQTEKGKFFEKGVLLREALRSNG